MTTTLVITCSCQSSHQLSPDCFLLLYFISPREENVTFILIFILQCELAAEFQRVHVFKDLVSHFQNKLVSQGRGFRRPASIVL